MGKYREIPIKEFALHEIKCDPGNDSKIVAIGKPGSGKSVLIKDIVRTFAHKFPAAVVFSGTEDNNSYYKEMFDDLFIYPEYSEDVMKAIYNRQKLAQAKCKNPKLMLIIDDCSDDPKLFRRPLFQKFFKMGRHWDIMIILALQYCHDIPPTIKSATDVVFIYNEPTEENRKRIYKNYATITGSYHDFCDIMDQVTEDFTALVINNRIQSNNPLERVNYYKARMHSKVKLSSPEVTAWQQTRYDPNYTKNFSLE